MPDQHPHCSGKGLARILYAQLVSQTYIASQTCAHCVVRQSDQDDKAFCGCRLLIQAVASEGLKLVLCLLLHLSVHKLPPAHLSRLPHCAQAWQPSQVSHVYISQACTQKRDESTCWNILYTLCRIWLCCPAFEGSTYVRAMYEYTSGQLEHVGMCMHKMVADYAFYMLFLCNRRLSGHQIDAILYLRNVLH